MTEHYLDRLARTINENWDQPALTDLYLTEDGSAQDTSLGNHYTYGEMYEEILYVCAIFQSLGLKQGDHIAICGTNSAHWAIAYLAIAAYQGVAVSILHSQSTEDIAHQIDFSDAKALFTDTELWEELKSQFLPQVEHVISLENWQILRGRKKVSYQLPITNHRCQFVHGSPDELAMICFTSGSTDLSKGIMIPYKLISHSISAYYAEKYESNILLVPLSHDLGLEGSLLSRLINAGQIYIYNDLLISKSIYECISNVKPNSLTLVPKILEELYAYSNSFFECMIENSCYIQVGGAKMNGDLENEIIKKIDISVVYGSTETGVISISKQHQHRLQSSGKITNDIVVCIASNGEIRVKGENVMLGYYKDPEATARKIDDDGWLHTGDKGHLDKDGYLYVEGRLENDMIVLPNGENIHPEDIERKINALPEVSESIVLARSGKLVAIVVPASLPFREESEVGSLRRHVLRTINPQIPLYSQLYDVEITDAPLQKTEKQTIKRYLYK